MNIFRWGKSGVLYDRLGYNCFPDPHLLRLSLSSCAECALLLTFAPQGICLGELRSKAFPAKCLVVWISPLNCPSSHSNVKLPLFVGVIAFAIEYFYIPAPPWHQKSASTLRMSGNTSSRHRWIFLTIVLPQAFERRIFLAQIAHVVRGTRLISKLTKPCFSGSYSRLSCDTTRVASRIIQIKFQAIKPVSAVSFLLWFCCFEVTHILL